MRAKKTKAIRKAFQSAQDLREKDRYAAKRRLLLFTKKFLTAVIVILIPVSLISEAWFGPLNRITAVLAGDILSLLSIDATVQGNLIQVHGFSANVIAECSAIHLVAICASFFYAFPSNISEKLKGLLFGVAVLFSLNVLRIAAVTLIGMKYPAFFEITHVYLGQLGMLIAVIVICLSWCQWISNDGRFDGPFAFLSRFSIFTSLPFLIWVPLHRYYLDAVDSIIRWIFSLVSYRLVMPESDYLHYHVFSMIALVGFIMSIKGVGLFTRSRWMGIGFTILTLLLLGYRLCVVWVTAFKIGWMVPVALLLYVMCVYALPLSAALLCLFKMGQGRKMLLNEEDKARVPT